MGLEPTTTGITILDSTIELQLPLMVAGPGIAPGTRAYETLEILLLQPAIDWC